MGRRGVSKELPVVAYERELHERALKRFTEKVLGMTVSDNRQQVIDTFHDRMPGRERLPLRHVLVDSDVIAGTLGYMPTEFLINGQRFVGRYTHDLLVDPEYRGAGLGKLIVAHAYGLGDFYPGGMWMTGQCHKIHRQVGFDDVANLVTYTAVLDPAGFTARRGFSPLKSMATRAGLGASRWMAMQRVRSVLSGAKTTLNTVRRMDSAFDPVWLALAKTYAITRVRDAAYLNWKYIDHPLLDYRTVVAMDAETPRGFLIWRPAPEGAEERRGVIADFLVARGDSRTLQEMAAHALMEASAAGIDAIATISTQSFAVSALKQLGFVAGGSHNSWVIAHWRGVLPDNAVGDLDQWHMCLGDSDGDIWTGST
jgi:GNAT superfamily N-acetyltransferase